MIIANFSKILVAATLLLLASFLAFWLYGEYQREKIALQNESYLGIANQLIDFKGGDLYSILNQLENNSKDSMIRIDWSISDSSFNVETKQKNYFSNKTITYKDQGEQFTGMMGLDSFIKMKKAFKTENGETAISIVMKSEDHDLSSDTLQQELTVAFTKSLQGDLVNNKASLRQDALCSIIPEFLFAIFLFSLLTSGVYLLQKSNAKEQELLESKNNLISNLTHELKTPITTIGVALEAIQDFNIKSDKEKTEHYIDLSRGELHRLSNAIDQVMLLSKIGSPSHTYVFQNQNIRTLCEAVVHNLQLQLNAKNARVQIHGADVHTKVDETHFKHMLHNLIDNSVKYGHAAATLIDIYLYKNGSKTILKITDNGPGIPSKYQHKIFERFFRIAKGDRHDVKGYGLGLSYVKEIVEAHKGSIQLESSPEQGTTFIISL